MSAGLRSERHSRQLELEGLVTIIPNKGAYVVGISQKDIQDIYEIRVASGRTLCKMGSGIRSPTEQLDELDENIFLSEFHAAKKDIRNRLLELDNQFP